MPKEDSARIIEAAPEPFSTMSVEGVPLRRRLFDLNKVFAGNTTVELLCPAALSDTAQIDGSKAEAFDEVYYSEPADMSWAETNKTRRPSNTPG
jgi:hypothetical protein